MYAIPAWGGFLPADLKSHINEFLRRLHRYGYTSTVFNVELQKTADGNMQSVAKKWDGKMHYEPSHF